MNLDMSMSLISKKDTFTIMRKIRKSIDEGEAPPGSLEECLESPENYLTQSIPDLSNINHKKYLKPADIYSKAIIELKNRKELESLGEHQLEDYYRKKFQEKNASKFIESTIIKDNDNIGAKYKSNKIEVSDDKIKSKYDEVKSRITYDLYNSMTDLNKTSLSQRLYETKQERFIKNYGSTERDMNNYYKQLSSSIGRANYESIVDRAKSYRERLEKAQVMEMATPTAIIYGTQSWYLSLRSWPKSKEIRHYMIPTNNLINGLCINITENPNKQVTMIRKPGLNIQSKFRTYDDKPFYIIKQRRESERVFNLLPMINNDNIYILLVKIV